MKCTTFILFMLFLNSCSGTDPTPETKDEIYKDLIIELDIATKALEEGQKNLDTLKKELDKALPQTGQVKFATKKLRGAEESVNQLTQRKIFFDIKKERRKAYVQFRYKESTRPGGRPWPDEKEVEVYKSITKFNREKLAWDKTKGVKKNVPRGTKVEAPESSEEEAPAH